MIAGTTVPGSSSLMGFSSSNFSIIFDMNYTPQRRLRVFCVQYHRDITPEHRILKNRIRQELNIFLVEFYDCWDSDMGDIYGTRIPLGPGIKASPMGA
jgi:hypothetical protein